MYRCHNCGKEFTTPNSYLEQHGLDTPPYEAVPICPHCASADFGQWEPTIDKDEVAVKMLTATAALNRYMAALQDIYGNLYSNDDLNTAYNCVTELIDEMYDEFICTATSVNITKIRTDNDINRILAQITGD